MKLKRCTSFIDLSTEGISIPKEHEYAKASKEAIDFDLNVAEMYQGSCEIFKLLNEVNEAYHSFELFNAICSTIKVQGGVTKSLEHMFGENFSSPASMEAESEVQKKAWYQKALDKIKELFEKFFAWIRKMIAKVNGKKISKSIKEIMDLKTKDPSDIHPLTDTELGYLLYEKKYQEEIDSAKLLTDAAFSSTDLKKIKEGAAQTKVSRMSGFAGDAEHQEVSFASLNEFNAFCQSTLDYTLAVDDILEKWNYESHNAGNLAARFGDTTHREGIKVGYNGILDIQRDIAIILANLNDLISNACKRVQRNYSVILNVYTYFKIAPKHN